MADNSFGSLLVQWNIRCFRANNNELIALLRKFTPMIACIQETMLGHHTPHPPGSYTAHYYSPDRAPLPGTGLLILSHQSVTCTALPLDTPLQAQAYKIGLSRPLTICNIYLPPNDHFTQANLETLLAQLPPPFLLVGDVNAKHPLWGGWQGEDFGEFPPQ